MHKTLSIVLVCVAACVLLPGCVVWDIRDNLVKSNQQIGEVKQALDKANAAIDVANDDLAKANERLDKVEAGLSRIDTTNKSLDGLDKQLALLGSIDTSLGHLDQHLAAVRKTIGSINSMIPFMDLGGGPEETQPAAAPAAAPTPTIAEGEKPEGANASTDAKAASSAPTGVPAVRRDVLEGAWVERAPLQKDQVARFIVLFADGTYAASAPFASQSASEAGMWSHEGTTLRLTPEAPILTSRRTDEKGNEVETKAPPPAREYAVVYATTRALVLKSKDLVSVYGRP